MCALSLLTAVAVFASKSSSDLVLTTALGAAFFVVFAAPIFSFELGVRTNPPWNSRARALYGLAMLALSFLCSALCFYAAIRIGDLIY